MWLNGAINNANKSLYNWSTAQSAEICADAPDGRFTLEKLHIFFT